MGAGGLILEEMKLIFNEDQKNKTVQSKNHGTSISLREKCSFSFCIRKTKKKCCDIASGKLDWKCGSLLAQSSLSLHTSLWGSFLSKQHIVRVCSEAGCSDFLLAFPADLLASASLLSPPPGPTRALQAPVYNALSY